MVMTRRPTRDWTSTPNDFRTRKNHLVTLTDEAWQALTLLAEATEKNSKSAVLEALILAAAKRSKKTSRGT